jgi:hypothetical protein
VVRVEAGATKAQRPPAVAAKNCLRVFIMWKSYDILLVEASA